jgi:uncharacterized membrane protein required for colicin V production
VVLAILLISTVIGWKKGLLRTALSLCSLLISLLLVWLLYPQVYTILSGYNPLQEAVYDRVNEFLTDEIPEQLSGILDTSGADSQNRVIETLPLPQALRDNLTKHNTADNYRTLGVESFSEYLCTAVTSLIIQGMAILLTLILAVIGLHVVIMLIDLIARLPVLNAMNKTGGMLAGFVMGYLIVQVVFLIITTFSGTGWGSKLAEQINESSILTFLYNSNVMVKMMISQMAKGLQG